MVLKRYMTGVALAALLAEWTLTDRTAAERIATLSSGVGDGGYVLDASSVFDDGYIDLLTGGHGDDWLLFTAGEDVVLP